jgi:peroxiredoxin
MKTAKTWALALFSLFLFYQATSLVSADKNRVKTLPKIGELAPEINLPDLNGKTLALSHLRGKMVLIDFWASWCAPCRLENRLIARMQREFSQKDFVVYSVSLDNDKDDWTAAIEKDRLIWNTHVSDLQGWDSNVLFNYGIEQIPSNFLVDKEGKILAVNVRGEELENNLRKYLMKR